VSWEQAKTIGIGRVEFSKPGVYNLILGSCDVATWKPVNVW